MTHTPTWTCARCGKRVYSAGQMALLGGANPHGEVEVCGRHFAHAFAADPAPAVTPEVERLRALVCALEERLLIAETDADRLAEALIAAALKLRSAPIVWHFEDTLDGHDQALQARRP